MVVYNINKLNLKNMNILTSYNISDKRKRFDLKKLKVLFVSRFIRVFKLRE